MINMKTKGQEPLMFLTHGGLCQNLYLMNKNTEERLENVIKEKRPFNAETMLGLFNWKITESYLVIQQNNVANGLKTYRTKRIRKLSDVPYCQDMNEWIDLVAGIQEN